MEIFDFRRWFDYEFETVMVILMASMVAIMVHLGIDQSSYWLFAGILGIGLGVLVVLCHLANMIFPIEEQSIWNGA